jgi:hypothetical protein
MARVPIPRGAPPRQVHDPNSTRQTHVPHTPASADRVVRERPAAERDDVTADRRARFEKRYEKASSRMDRHFNRGTRSPMGGK